MQSYNSFIDNINDNFAVPHLQIQRFEEGFYDNMQSFETANEQFPFMWLVPTRVDHLENSVSQYDIRVYFIDILEKDDSNERDVLSDQQQIARDFTNWIRQNQNNGFELLRTPSSVPVKSVMLDYTAGWYVDLSINVDTEMTECAIPFSGSTGGTMTCPDGTVINSGSTYSVSVPSGSIVELPNELISIIDLSGNTLISWLHPPLSNQTVTLSGVCESVQVVNSGATYDVTVESGDILNLPNITNTDSDGSPVTVPAQTPFVCTPPVQSLTIVIEVGVGDDTSELTIIPNSEGTITTLNSGGLTITDLQVNAVSVSVPFSVVDTDVVTIIYTTAASDTVITLTGTY